MRSVPCRCFFALLSLLVSAAAGAGPSERYGRLPLHFEQNRGQVPEEVHFLARAPGYTLFLTGSEAVLARSSSVLRMRLVGAEADPRVSGLDPLAGKAHYFVGSDRSKWRTDVPTYAKVRYDAVYPGIDLVYYGNQRQLEYDFVVAPGADPQSIVLEFQGAERIEIDDAGDLLLHTAVGEIRQHKPVIYQDVDGARTRIEGGYVLAGADRIGFQIAAYHRDRPLVIDPVLVYSTYLGGSDQEDIYGLAVDAAGAAYVLGQTSSTDFPPPGRASARRVLFLAKLDATGSALVYSTIVGGSGLDTGGGIVVDAAGAAYVTGTTHSSDFPTTAGAFDTTYNAPDPGSSETADAFVFKLDAAGSGLIYATYLGGRRGDFGAGIAVDAAGIAHVTGSTLSTDFPTTAGAFATDHRGMSDAFVVKLDAAGSALVYSTLLGGSGNDTATAIALGATGSAHVSGGTFSTDFPVSGGAFDTTHNGSRDLFVAKLSESGAELAYATFLGGSALETPSGGDIAVDATGAAYVTGATESANFPTTPGAFDATYNGSGDAFVVKLDAAGSTLVYATFLGGSGIETSASLAVDAAGAVYVGGSTSSTNFPTTEGAFARGHSGGFFDLFVAKLDPAGSAPTYATYLGGNDFDLAQAFAVDAVGAAYMTGVAFRNFPTTAGAFDATYNGAHNFTSDGFVAKLALGTVFLVIDKEGIDDGKAPNFFSAFQVNDDVAQVGVRAQLRFFQNQAGQTIALPAGKVGAEGWLALKTIPQSWAQAGGLAGFVGNPAANPEDPVPHGTGPGLGVADDDDDDDSRSLLRKVPGVTPLRATGLRNLIGRTVCAVVYDRQVTVNYDRRSGDLRGANLGTVAFRVASLALPTDASPDSLPDVQVTIQDARSACRGPLTLLTDADAPTPQSPSEPFDVQP